MVRVYSGHEGGKQKRQAFSAQQEVEYVAEVTQQSSLKHDEYDILDQVDI